MTPEGDSKEALLKEASAALRKTHRRIEAEKVAFAFVERGKVPAFSSYERFQEKVAEILAKDVGVVREALELDAGLADFGKVAEAPGPAGGDAALAAFYHALAD